MRMVQATVVLLVLSSVLVPGAPLEAGAPTVASFAVREGGEGLSIHLTGCAGAIVAGSDPGFEQQVVEAVNAERAAHGLPPLKRSSALRDAARYHARDMAQDNYFHHDTHDRVGDQLKRVCDTWSRISSYYPSPRAENIAAGYATPQAVMAGWMESGGHRSSILNPDYREMGVGYARGGSWGHYWVQDFGARSGVYPLVIDREAASTDSTRVSLYLYGCWDQVRLRNGDGPWSSWRPFANELAWTLPARAGEHTVWAEMRGGGQTVQSSDTISVRALPTLGGLPCEIRFLYSLPEGRLLPGSARVTPRNTGNEVPLAWQATVEGAWFEGRSLSGQAGDSFQVVPAGLPGAPGTYRGRVTVAATDPAGVQSSPQQIDLVLQVVDTTFKRAYLPVLSAR